MFIIIMFIIPIFKSRYLCVTRRCNINNGILILSLDNIRLVTDKSYSIFRWSHIFLHVNCDVSLTD